jgi:hypothetical protein
MIRRNICSGRGNLLNLIRQNAPKLRNTPLARVLSLVKTDHTLPSLTAVITSLLRPWRDKHGGPEAQQGTKDLACRILSRCQSEEACCTTVNGQDVRTGICPSSDCCFCALLPRTTVDVLRLQRAVQRFGEHLSRRDMGSYEYIIHIGVWRGDGILVERRIDGVLIKCV